ncbi:hypothetical protein A3860_33505 [Niastella vici]|uniref:Uncharacterized protein n=1 Tax=Niastella vici TaxID=1703345 RepID=A0A1V9FQ21_9BACT|nr:hypothetical protein A3860_33505 [Niastella vici]
MSITKDKVKQLFQPGVVLRYFNSNIEKIRAPHFLGVALYYSCLAERAIINKAPREGIGNLIDQALRLMQMLRYNFFSRYCIFFLVPGIGVSMT